MMIDKYDKNAKTRIIIIFSIKTVFRRSFIQYKARPACLAKISFIDLCSTKWIFDNETLLQSLEKK